MRVRTHLKRISIAGVALLTAGIPASIASAQGDIEYVTGEITLVAGDANAIELGDGGPAVDALIVGPTGVDRDPEGNLYTAGSDGRVRRVAPDGTISTFAGGGSPASGNGDGGAAVDASFERPFDIVFDEAGNAYISDFNNGVVRKVDTDGTISTFAGGGTPLEGNGDGGPATDAALPTPAGLDWHEGELYIASGFGGVVRKVAADGTISTIAGAGTIPIPVLQPLDTDLGIVLGVDVDADGNVFIASNLDAGFIWKLDTTGDLTLVAGREPLDTDEFPPAGNEGLAATGAVLSGGAYDVAVHPNGGFLISGDGLVRSVDPDGIITTLVGQLPADGPTDALQALQGVDADVQTPFGLHLDDDDTFIFTDNNDATVHRVILEDVTDPIVTVELPESISRFTPATASISCSDNRPGVVCTGAADGSALDTSLANPAPIVATGTDDAGNETTVTAPYSVEWEITGTHAGSSGTEATIARLYAAYFGRLAEPGGFAYWESELAADPAALIAASNFFSESTEFQTLYGSITNDAFVELIYRNVMGRTPEPAGFDFWVLQLEQESFTRGEVMLFFSQSVEFQQLTQTS